MRQLTGAEAERVKQEKLWKTQEICTGAGWNQNGRIPCGEVFEIDEMEIQRRSHSDYGGGSDTYYGFTCPVCGCFTELNEKQLPSYVKSKARPYIPIESSNGDR